MIYTIRVFAGLAERMGGASVSLEAEDGLTVGELKKRLSEAYPDAAAGIAVSFVAQNQAYAPDTVVLHHADELALIPPVSGGQGAAPCQIALYQLTNEEISIDEVSRKVAHPDHGAALLFIGSTREHTAGLRTVNLEYEAYEPMAISTMKRIGEEIAERWPGALCAITHRLGLVQVGEISVVIAVSTPHRGDSYEASRYAIERLKQIVPIWKKEQWENGAEWKGHQTGPWNPLAPVSQGGVS